MQGLKLKSLAWQQDLGLKTVSTLPFLQFAGDTFSKVMNVSKHRSRALPLDIISEILERLPVKYILRCRCVCKRWNSLSREHQFIIAHLRKNLKPDDFDIISLRQFYDPYMLRMEKLYLHWFVKGHHKFDITQLCGTSEERFWVSNSCNGLIYVYGKHTAYLINPAIKEWLQLPKSHETSQTNTLSVALVHHASTGECKVIRLFDRKYGINACEVYEVGSNSWRSAQDPPLLIRKGCVPVVIDGAIYWLASINSGFNAIAVCFDLKNETFDMILPPEDFKYDGSYSLLELDGQLGLSIVKYDKQNQLRCFVWEYHGNRVWRKKRIIISQSRMPRYSLPVAYRDGKFVWHSFDGEYYCHDAKSKSLKVIKIKNVDKFGLVCPYKESLISPAAIRDRILKNVLLR